MRPGLVVLAVALLLIAPPAFAQDEAASLYRIELENEGRVQVATRVHEGKPGLYITVRFLIRRTTDGQPDCDVTPDDLVVEEDGQRVAGLEVQVPTASEPLTIILALDVSGSMADHGKMDQAKQAAALFLDRLDPHADCGLVLFDHELHDPVAPVKDPQRFGANRQLLRSHIQAAQPGGGTAYLDATATAIDMLQAARGRKAVLVMTDGVDLNSRHTLQEVISQARAAGVTLHTLGIGEPGKQDPVSTVLVLDHSGSMQEPADDQEKLPKIFALHRAAVHFTDLMRPGAQTSLLPFGTTVEMPQPFTANKKSLKNAIDRLQPGGETALFDAAYIAVETLVAARREGKQAVIVLTDGIDNRSRHRPEEVMDLARRFQVPLHLLGFGRPGELNQEVMQRMARETGGQYRHARNEQDLFHIFEDLSIQLHDDGIDEGVLRRLAEETGGKYYPAREASSLQLIYEKLAEELQTTYTATFPSRRPNHDGTARGIEISVVRKGTRVSDVASVAYQVHGVVVPEMDARVYLGLLAVLAALVVLPTALRRCLRFYSRTAS